MTKLPQNSRKIPQQIYGCTGVFLNSFYCRFLKLRGTPHQISMGVALGVFVGMTPFLGFHTLIAVALASFFKWSKITSALGVFITNPLTAPMIYPITYKLGSMITGFSDPAKWLKVFEPGGVVDLLKRLSHDPRGPYGYERLNDDMFKFFQEVKHMGFLTLNRHSVW